MNAEITKKIQTAMNILAGLCPRVDQVATITQPIAAVVNLLADVRDALIKADETQETEENTDA